MSYLGVVKVVMVVVVVVVADDVVGVADDVAVAVGVGVGVGGVVVVVPLWQKELICFVASCSEASGASTL